MVVDTNGVEAEDEEKTVKKGKLKFDWDKIIIELLTSLPDKEMAVKKLRKKVVGEYFAQGGTESSEDAVIKFNKKIEKIPGVVVLKERAKLKSRD